MKRPTTFIHPAVPAVLLALALTAGCSGCDKSINHGNPPPTVRLESFEPGAPAQPARAVLEVANHSAEDCRVVRFSFKFNGNLISVVPQKTVVPAGQTVEARAMVPKLTNPVDPKLRDAIETSVLARCGKSMGD